MHFLRKLRHWHRWISVLITPAFAITLVTGLLLATRGFNTWLQPEYSKTKFALKTNFDQILKAARAVPEAQILDWKDVSQIDIRPDSGMIRVRSKHGMVELQINGETGSLVALGVRRVSWLTSLHEGAYFGPWVRYGLFFVSSIGVLFLLISGVVLAVFHYWQNYRRRRPAST